MPSIIGTGSYQQSVSAPSRQWLHRWLVSVTLWSLLPKTACSLQVKRVVVVGGTHGNEYTGVWCIRELQQPHRKEGLVEKYPSLNVETILGNPLAHLKNQRFVDEDLNRQFATDKLLYHDSVCSTDNHQDDAPVSADAGGTLPYEARRAVELNAQLGPKHDGSHGAADVVIDLHTTTTNMGISLIVPEGDVLMMQAAAYARHKCNDHNPEAAEARILVNAISDRDKRPNLGSVAPHGITVEVGPVPQGLLRYDAVEKTNRALSSVLEFLERHNQDQDGLWEELKGYYGNNEYKLRVPCYQPALAKGNEQLTGKIAWPSRDPENPNFPTALVHPSVQDRDFQLIRTGDPLFVLLDGTVLPYTGSHGDQVYLIFVNEGGYYYSSSGAGIGVAITTHYDLANGKLLPCEADQDVCVHF